MAQEDEIDEKEEVTEVEEEEEENEEEEEEEVEEQKPEKKKVVVKKVDSSMDEFGRHEYWAGTKKGCPKQNMHVRGITFHRSIDKVTHAKGSLKTQRRSYPGGMVWLSPKDAKAVRAAIGAKVVTTSGVSRIAEASEFGRGSSAKPLGDFLYLIKIADAVELSGAHWRDEDPPAMSAR